jgi:hypothetical protein
VDLFEDLEAHESNVYSQCGDDGVLLRLFEHIGVTNRRFVEFGAWDGVHFSNTANLRLHHGWSGLLMEGSDRADGHLVKRETISAENVNALFARYAVPESFDLLSIDIDGNDYWVWKAIRGFRARVVVIEYNALFGLEVSKVMPYDPNHVWDKTGYHGASLAAMRKLGMQLGYSLVFTNVYGANTFFVLRSELPADYVELPLEGVSRGIWCEEPPGTNGRPWVNV